MPRSTDVMGITAFTRAYQRVCKELRRDGRPRILVVDGRPAVVVQDAAAYDRLLDSLHTTREMVKGLSDDRPRLSVAQSRARIAALAAKKQRASSGGSVSHRAA